ncbi:glycosyltransferase [Butyrivibrio sp. NC3005]|uniref:glycosyltransferase n=1 Tax=Butyrivibrio sp. NC3005 TaxID=1280685 RepID=UPI000429DB05|nr:glycosyltransferase [Butyrivibrio sp. NC3005]
MSKVNEAKNFHKVAFIICSFDDDYLNECLFYISRLHIPFGFAVEVVIIDDPFSIASGYNDAMCSCDAAIKIYLSEKLFILNQNFIYDIIACFRQDSAIGAIGIKGASFIQKRSDGKENYNIGASYVQDVYSDVITQVRTDKKVNEFGVTPRVHTTDETLLVTRYDYHWEERLYGDYFNIASQCIILRKHNHQIAIPYQDCMWAFYDEVLVNSNDYEFCKAKFYDLYKNYFAEFRNTDITSYKSLSSKEKDKLDKEIKVKASVYTICNRLLELVKSMLNEKQYYLAFNALKDAGTAICYNKLLIDIHFILEIHHLEDVYEMLLFADSIECKEDESFYEALLHKFNLLKFMMRRVAFSHIPVKTIMQLILKNKFSMIAIIVTTLHFIPEEYFYILGELGQLLKKEDEDAYSKWNTLLVEITKYEEQTSSIIH